MKVVFLDIDGVLNHLGMLEQLDEQHRARGCMRTFAARADGGSCDCYALTKQMDRANVARLNTLLERTGAVVVISSSWRKLLDADEIAHILQEHGFTGKVVGETPDLPNDEHWKTSTRGTKWIDRIERGHEIEAWILRHDAGRRWAEAEPRDAEVPERVEGFVVLDDCGDMAGVRSCLVQTDDRHGLDDQDVVIAEVILNARSPRVLAEIREEAA